MLCSSHPDYVNNPETAPIVTYFMSTGLAVRQSATSEQLAYHWSAMSHGLDLEKTSLVTGIVQYEYGGWGNSTVVSVSVYQAGDLCSRLPRLL